MIFFTTKIKFIFFLFLLISGFHITSQAQDIRFSHLSVESGLSQNSVLAITQDTRGFMWFGTRNGLNRYDGHEFKIYKNTASDTSSLTSNYISALLCDSRGMLWVGTQTGLHRYNPQKDTFEHFTGDALNTPYYITAIYEDKNKKLWIASSEGLYEFTNNKMHRLKQVYKPLVQSLCDDAEGNLWLGTAKGLIKRTIKRGKATYQNGLPSNPANINNLFILAITIDKSQNLWIGTLNDGIIQYNKTTNTYTRYSHAVSGVGVAHNSIRKILPDKTGKFLIGTLEGLSILDPVTRKIVSYKHELQNKNSLSHNSIYSIFCDAYGIIWIGTYFGGVNVIYPSNTRFSIYQAAKSSHSLTNNVVSSIQEDTKGNLWIGTEGGGLNYFDRQNGIFKAYQNVTNNPHSLGSNLVKAVYRDKKNNIWVASSGGELSLFNPDTDNFFHYPQKFGNDINTAEILTVTQDSYGRLWTGSFAGLGLLKKDSGYITKAPNEYKLHNKHIKFLYEDKQKNLWIGTFSGLQVFMDAGKSVKVFLKNEKDKNSLQSDNINCIQQDSRGNIWIGTYYGGLSMYNKATQKFITYTQKDGLANNNVLGILEDSKGDLWISTGNGLCRFNLSRKTFTAYTQSDGLASNEFNHNSFFKDSKGQLFFGGYNGLTAFNPADIETNRYVAPMVFTTLKLFNKPVDINGKDGLLKKNINLTNELVFKYDQNIFTIEFALLNFEKSDKNKYAYQLEGFEKNWNYSSNYSATYMNLPPGNYTFLVRGANNDGIWSTAPASMHITVLPPFWKTWWAYFLYIVLLATILFFVARFFFLRALLKKEEDLHQAKLNFFTNISHEIRTRLSLIIGPIEKMMLNKKEDDADSRQLKYIHKNSDSLLQLVNELLDFRKAESENLQLHVFQEDIVLFVHEVYNAFQHSFLSKNITPDFNASAQNILLWFDKRQLQKVLFNLLSNSFKFTSDGGKVFVSIEERNTSIEITVTDNGEGIAPENLEKLFQNYFQENDYGKQNTGYGIGLALSKSIVKLHKGNLTAESEILNNGAENKTSFIISLLKGNEHFTAEQLLQKQDKSPLIIQEHSPDESNETPFVVYEDDDKSEKKYTVLIVEDNIEVRAFIRGTLSDRYEVIESINGFMGWECATEMIPDLIVTDVMMPEMDGLTLCRKLKADERTSHVPVIMLTGKGSTESQISGLQLGADVYMSKPFSIQILLLHIRNLLIAKERMRHKFSIALSLPIADGIEKIASTINPVDEAFLQKLIQLIEEHLDNTELGVEMICKKVAMSRSVLYKKLKAVTDMSVNDFVKSIRLTKAIALLQQKHLNINEVAYMVGFSDRKYFSKEFKKQFGKTPSEYIKEQDS